jgi:hypothetical protein
MLLVLSGGVDAKENKGLTQNVKNNTIKAFFVMLCGFSISKSAQKNAFFM